MCRGIQEKNQASLCSTDAVSSHATSNSVVCCELCSSRASLYCQADDAFLCQKCDKSVHGANFLALRHVRCVLCNTCQKLTQRYLVGASMEVVFPTIDTQRQGMQCDSDTEDQRSGSPELPFQFL
ncbi:hypothetical protein Tsubulata_033177 [Turnera subulata]|uniref:B box-type domain-containing protein n=1 Tax=Turnera subulata TaxID=218843 RepID=A0A9Q0FHR8_9ROSI|nr:hypothetical protein Tsubulata_033177 [Turnera subulata]